MNRSAENEDSQEPPRKNAEQVIISAGAASADAVEREKRLNSRTELLTWSAIYAGGLLIIVLLSSLAMSENVVHNLQLLWIPAVIGGMLMATIIAPWSLVRKQQVEPRLIVQELKRALILWPLCSGSLLLVAFLRIGRHAAFWGFVTPTLLIGAIIAALIAPGSVERHP